MIRLLRNLGADSRGAAVIELGLIAPILATMTVGIIDLTTAFNRKLELEQGVQRSIERVMQTTGGETPVETVKAEVSSATGIDSANVTVTYTLTCNGTVTNYDLECAAGESEVRYLNASATDTFTPLLPLSRLGLSNSSFTLTAESGIRTL